MYARVSDSKYAGLSTVIIQFLIKDSMPKTRSEKALVNYALSWQL